MHDTSNVTSAPALPPWRLRAPGCPASLTPIIYYSHLPSLVTRISDIGHTWTHLSPFISSPIFVSSPALFPAAAFIVFCLCYLFADAVPVSFHVFIKCFTPRTCFVSPASSHWTSHFFNNCFSNNFPTTDRLFHL